MKLDDGTVLKGVVRLENIEGAEFGDKGYLLAECCAWVKDIFPIPITHKILCKNEWNANAIEYDYSIKDKLYFRAFTDYKTGGVVLEVYTNIAPSDGGVGMGNDKLLRTDFVRLRNMLAIFKRRYAKTNYEADSIQEVIEAVDRRLGY